jgi:hypothetical protein
VGTASLLVLSPLLPVIVVLHVLEIQLRCVELGIVSLSTPKGLELELEPRRLEAVEE